MTDRQLLNAHGEPMQHPVYHSTTAGWGPAPWMQGTHGYGPPPFYDVSGAWGPFPSPTPVRSEPDEWTAFIRTQKLQAEAERQRVEARRLEAERSRPLARVYAPSQGMTRGYWWGKPAGKHPGYRVIEAVA